MIDNISKKYIFFSILLFSFLSFPFFINRTFEISIQNSVTEDFNLMYFNAFSTFNNSYRMLVSGEKKGIVQKRTIPFLLSKNLKFQFSEKNGNTTNLKIHSISDTFLSFNFNENIKPYSIRKASNLITTKEAVNYFEFEILDTQPSLNLCYFSYFNDLFSLYFTYYFYLYFIFITIIVILLFFLFRKILPLLSSQWKEENSHSKTPIELINSIKVKVMTFFCVSYLLLFSALKYHNSSIGIWNVFISEANQTHSWQFSEPREIRTDEYLVVTPLILSQFYNKFQKKNVTLAHENAVISTTYNLPANFSLSVLLPFNYGFLFFKDIEYGFAFRFNLIFSGLLLSTFILLFLLTKGNFTASLIGGFWVVYSSPVQWWYYIYPMWIICLNILSISTIILITSNSIRSTLICCISIVIFSFQFLYILYPPIQITFGYLFLIILIFYIFDNKHLIVINKFTKIKISILLLFLTSLLLSVFVYLIEIKEVIYLILNTDYPGKRVSIGGSLPIYQIITGFFDRYLLDGVPTLYPNQSEASKFLPISLVILPLLPLYIKNKKWLISSILIYTCLLYTKAFSGLPEILEKVLLLNLVPNQRIELCSGIVGIYSSIIIFSDDYSKSIVKNNQKYFQIYGFFILIIFIILFLWLNKLDPTYFNFIRIVINLLFLSLLIYSFYSFKPIVLGFSLCFYLGLNIFINPLYKGLAPLYSISYRDDILTKINGSQNDLIIYMGKGNTISYFLIARGFNTFSGVKYYPDLEQMKIFDESQQFKSIYNRYAHIYFEEDSNEIAKFELNGLDSYKIRISPCSTQLKKFGVRYIVIQHNEKENSFSSLACRKDIKPIYTDSYNYLDFYSIDQFKEHR